MRTSTGRGTSCSPSRHGATDGVSGVFAAKRHGAAATRPSMARRFAAAIAASETARQPAVERRPKPPVARLAQHGLAGGGIAQPHCRHARQRKLLAQQSLRQRRAGTPPTPAPPPDPLPGLLTMRTWSRDAASSPDTPMPSASSSSGSTDLPSMPRNSTPIRCRPRSVFRNRPPSRTVRSSPSTSAQDSSRASSTCPYQAGSSWPGVSSADRPASPVSIGAIRWIMSRQISTNGSMWQSSCEANSSGRTRPSRRRFCNAWARPSASPVRSASTCHVAVRRAHQVGGIELQQVVRLVRADVAAWAQECRIGIDQCRRHRAIGQQALRAVDIGQYRIEQPRALRQSRFEFGKFRLRQRQRDRIETPRIGRRARQQAGDAFLLHHAVESRRAFGQDAVAKSGKHAEQTAPLRAQPPLAVHHLVACHARRLTSQSLRRKSPTRRKSSVRGCSRERARPARPCCPACGRSGRSAIDGGPPLRWRSPGSARSYVRRDATRDASSRPGCGRSSGRRCRTPAASAPGSSGAAH